MTARWEIPISLTVSSPFIFPGLRASAVGVDRSALRDEDGRPLLPGDQIKGLVRQAMTLLPDKALMGLRVRELFGPEHGENLLDEPERGLLRFTDFVGPETTQKAMVTRIQVDEETGVVKDGHLQNIELVAPMGAEVRFDGRVHYYGADGEKVRGVLNKALRLVPYFGAARSVGFGEHVAHVVGVGETRRSDLIPAAAGVDGDVLDIIVEFDRPYLVAAERLAGNLARGAAIVPGGALKGALAQILERAGKDVRTHGAPYEAALRLLRLSHAFPMDGDGKELGRALPFSVMLHPKSGEMACALRSDTPGLFQDGACADFSPDWKDSDAIADGLGRPPADAAKLPLHERGHVMLGATTGAAERGLLHIEVARGRYMRRSGEGLKARFRADFSACPVNTPEADRAVRDVRAVLSSALWDVGKTNAALFLKAGRANNDTNTVGQPPWRLLLETDGVLVDPESRPEMTVGEQLTAYLAHVVPGCVLERWFVRRRLVGGYQARRFTEGAYRPQSLFLAGSCFLLGAVAGQAVPVGVALAKLARRGLPVCAWESGALVERNDWRKTPFLPESGYGAVSIDDPVFERIGVGQA